MLKNQKHSKDSMGVGYENVQCSTSDEASKGDKIFVSSSMNDHKHTFKVSNAPRKKIDLNTTAKNMKTHVVDPKKNTIVVATINNHTDPKGKVKLDDDGFTRVKDMSKKFSRPRYVAPRRKMWNNFNNNNWYASQFHGYCYKCNAYGHKISDCRPMYRSPPSYECMNPFSALRGVNVVCYYYNEFGHKIYES